MHNILITQKTFIDKHGQLNWSLENNWFKYFDKKRINLIPLNFNTNNKKKFLSLRPIGLILSGGNDLYDKVRSKENLIRDNYEIKLLDLAIRNNIPVLAVCRGFQLVAKFFGSKITKTVNHVRSTHTLKINNKKNELKTKVLKVNSYHNYAINNLPSFFDFTVKHSDGSIEIAKSNRYKILSLMFHPERKNISQKYINNIVFSHFKIK